MFQWIGYCLMTSPEKQHTQKRAELSDESRITCSVSVDDIVSRIVISGFVFLCMCEHLIDKKVLQGCWHHNTTNPASFSAIFFLYLIHLLFLSRSLSQIEFLKDSLSLRQETYTHALVEEFSSFF